MDNKLNIDDILTSKLGKISGINEIKVSFRKTIQTKPYESEVTETEYSLSVDNEITGIERMVITSILQAQAEYTIYTMLALQNKITTEEFMLEKKAIEDSINAIIKKAKGLVGDRINIDELIENTITHNKDIE